MDERIKKLAANLVRYSCEVKPGEKLYIHYIGEKTHCIVRESVLQYKLSKVEYKQTNSR